MQPNERMVCPEQDCKSPLQATQLVFWDLDSRTGKISTTGGDRNIFTGTFMFEIKCNGGHRFPRYTGTAQGVQAHLQDLAKIVKL